MSHFKERHEKICLNCNAELYGGYCHVCGQHNIEPKQTAWGLVTHFFNDITHFDGKFFSTTKYLITRPGFLSKEYINGRRASYLDPIRMYVFTSAVFFLIFYSVFNVREMGMKEASDKAVAIKKASDYRAAKAEALRDAKTSADSARTESAFALIEDFTLPEDVKIDSVPKSKKRRKGLVFSGADKITREQYDSVQKKLPPDEKDNWLERVVKYRNIELTKKYGSDNEGQLWTDVLDRFLHTFPYLLFISLPLYAFFLKLLYIRRKRFYYVDHVLFLVHLYIFTFIILLIFFGMQSLTEAVDSYIQTWWITLLEIALFVYGIIYTLKAMRRFYEQSRTKTFFKFIILNFLAFIAITLLFSFSFIFALFRL